MTVKEISERTPIALGAAIAALLFSSGLAAWGAVLQYKVDKAEMQLEANQLMFQEIRERLIRIEEKQK